MAEPSRADIQRQLVELLDYPREDVDTEIKDWLPLESRPAQADLVRELIALANHDANRRCEPPSPHGLCIAKFRPLNLATTAWALWRFLRVSGRLGSPTSRSMTPTWQSCTTMRWSPLYSPRTVAPSRLRCCWLNPSAAR